MIDPTTQLVQIEKPVYGGDFIARLNGKAVFVPLTLPGEKAQIHIVEDKRAYARAEMDTLVHAAPERVMPACLHFGACGGCHYQHTNYDTQLVLKQSILRETLERGGLAIPSEIAVLAGEPWHYRNRIRLAFDAHGNPGYRGRRSHLVVPIAECPIAAPLLLHAAHAFRDALRLSRPTLRPTEITLFCNHDESALLVQVVLPRTSRTQTDKLAAALYERIPAVAGIEFLLEGRKGQSPRRFANYGDDSILYRAAGCDYRVDHGAFFQVNRWLLDGLVEHVVVGRTGHLAWDLFAGVGFFARQLTAGFDRVLAVESAPTAAPALTHNLRGTAALAHRSETLSFLRHNASQDRPDLIVLDPPRAGLGTETASLLAAIGAPQIVYVSCDPATLTRDLRALTASGYAVTSVTLADLFPQTFHLETVVQLRRA